MRIEPGQPAIGFEVKDLEGQTRSLEDYRGKKLLLAFHRYAS